MTGCRLSDAIAIAVTIAMVRRKRLLAENSFHEMQCKLCVRKRSDDFGIDKKTNLFFLVMFPL